MLLGVGVFLRVRQPGSQKHVLLLPRKPVGDPQPSQVSHLRGMQAHFFLQLTARQLLGIFHLHLPSALRQLQRPLLDGVAKLLHQPHLAPVDGQDDGRVVLVHHSKNALLPVRAQNLVLPEPHPVVPIHLAAGKGGNGAACGAFCGVHTASFEPGGIVCQALGTQRFVGWNSPS